jgi:hypothetical protein
MLSYLVAQFLNVFPWTILEEDWRHSHAGAGGKGEATKLMCVCVCLCVCVCVCVCVCSSVQSATDKWSGLVLSTQECVLKLNGRILRHVW